jgi:dienelactone hydrolase
MPTVNRPVDLPALTSVRITCGDQSLFGDLASPAGASGVIAFAHGSGSSRFSARNQHVASVLQQLGFATLLIDLLTPDEDAVDSRTAHLRFDIELLASRIVAVIDWLRRWPRTSALPIGLFGASTGGGAALVAAAARPRDIRAIVSRGGRPDLADAALSVVVAPTLLIVGGKDHDVIAVNRDALMRMSCEVVLDIVPNASHLFEEPGALDRVAELAGAWFGRYLTTDITPH